MDNMKLVVEVSIHSLLSSFPIIPAWQLAQDVARRFARMADGGLFPRPDDIAITQRECRSWQDKTGILRVGKEQGVYFHVNLACVREGQMRFL